MGLRFDHAFVFVPPGGEEAEVLAAAGLAEGPPNVHPGQGTANRRFFFRNGMLELLWVRDESEAGSPPIARTRLLERARYRETEACPFGIALALDGGESDAPFSTWPYTPPYLPDGLAIPVATASDDPARPFVFRMPAGLPPARRGESPFEVTAVEVHYPAFDPRDFSSCADHEGIVRFGIAREAVMTVTLCSDRAARPAPVDLRPRTPLVLQWEATR